jgi:hypothetical protein
MLDPYAMMRLQQCYLNNQFWVFPAHKDCNPAAGLDRFLGVTPCALMSVGSSGSDRYYVRAALAVSAALRADVKKAVKERKWAPIDCMLYLFQPIRILTYGIITLMAWIQTAYPQGNIPFFQLQDMTYVVPTWVWYALVIGQFLWTPLVLLLEKRLNLKICFYYLTYYFFSLTWAPIAVIGILRKNKKEWFHTQHTRTMEIGQMKKK